MLRRHFKANQKRKAAQIYSNVTHLTVPSKVKKGKKQEASVIEIPCDAGVPIINENTQSSTCASKKKKAVSLLKNHKRTMSNLSLNDCESVQSKCPKPKQKLNSSTTQRE